MVEQPEFGRRVREIRSARGLSQSDIAGKGMSPSYISLVESGNRTPSPKVVRAIAERLGITPDELSSPAPRELRRTHRVELVGRLIAARSHQIAGDLGFARDELLDVIRQATDSGMDEILWEAHWELALTLGRLGQCDAREETLRQLLAAPLTESSPLLRARVAVETADLLRRSGRLSESVRLAEEALRSVPADETGAPERVQAQVSLLSGWLESGEWQRAAGLCDELLQSAGALHLGQLHATALWVAAEYRYVAGEQEQALALLDRALSLTGPEADIRVRVRMLWAAALLHLAADSEETAEELTERVGQAVALLGTHADAARVATLRALVALRRGAVERALEHAREAGRGREELPPIDRACCAVAVARTHRAAGRSADAEAEYQTAAALYEAAGAYRSASAVWRELSVPDGAPTTPDHSAIVTP
ncbi:helix-turn-helix domain-containing protein [Streptomyces sp. P9(2023)]|uniref:helix-turn-helix domain-containing protein n=1 Tax=Streptomyces sp. P9(2023) TaxID=3064394 RepID=UPI0028F45F98|nr:helix-turn-helix domain-containing protein [Streptomyces sp. P9(2023)]MDT9692108.1 helix-turn-helix domain-containing protein [Streptomyces sp. P9(2023)]